MVVFCNVKVIEYCCCIVCRFVVDVGCKLVCKFSERIVVFRYVGSGGVVYIGYYIIILVCKVDGVCCIIKFICIRIIVIDV